MSTATTIQQYYNAFYGRPADPSGLAFWVNGVNGTGDLIGSAIRAFGSPSTPEFSLRFPAGTPISTFLDTAYGNMFNRAPDADGKSFWSAAFTNWVSSGKSEGEARALILQNFVDAANGQSGTNDKLTITNKLTVADMMTASVKAYGTESVYMTQLNKAQGLLAGVDHTQASVDAALAKIKVGGIYSPGDVVPTAPTTIDSFDKNGITLSTEKVEILKFSSASDAPFSYVKTATFNNGLSLSISNFSATADRIDLTKFNFGSSGVHISSSFYPWKAGEFTTFNGATPPAYKTYFGFFSATPLIKVEVGSGNPWASTDIFIDINKNGNLDPEADLWITLNGVADSAINESIFIF